MNQDKGKFSVDQVRDAYDNHKALSVLVPGSQDGEWYAVEFTLGRRVNCHKVTDRQLQSGKRIRKTADTLCKACRFKGYGFRADSFRGPCKHMRLAFAADALKLLDKIAWKD